MIFFSVGSFGQKITSKNSVGIERIDYNLSIGFLRVGKATLKYSNRRLSGHRSMVAHAYSTGIVDFFYDFDFKFNNQLHKKNGLPFISCKEFYEGNYHTKNTVRFDHFSRPDSSIVESDSIGTKVVPKGIYDILSGVYHIMNHEINRPLRVGDTITTQCYFTDEVWNLKMVYVKDDKIKTFRGHENCRKFHLIPQKGYFFKNDDDIAFWFTLDGLSIPVLIKMNFVLSSIKAQISYYENTLKEKRPSTP